MYCTIRRVFGFCRSVPNGDVSVLFCSFLFDVSNLTRENTLLYDGDGHFAVVGAVIAPRRHGFH